MTRRERSDRVAVAERLATEGAAFPTGCSGFVCAVVGIAPRQAIKLLPDDVSERFDPATTELGAVVGFRGHVAVFVSRTNPEFIDVSLNDNGHKPRRHSRNYGAVELRVARESDLQ